MATDPTTIPSVEDLQETKEYMEDINEFVNSENDTLVDSDGNTRRTLTGINNEFDAAQAGEFTTQAIDAAERAETAADVAVLNASIYPNTTEGLLSTADGDYFSIVSPDDENYLDLYLNDTGSAVFQKSYPSSSVVSSLEEGDFSKLGLQLQAMSPETGYMYAITDATGYAAILVRLDGTTEIPKKLVVGDSHLTTLRNESGYIFAVEDESGRVAGIKTNGRFSGGIEGESPANKVTGEKGEPLFPSMNIACWGDSMTAGAGSGYGGGEPYPTTLAELSGRQVFNGGVGGTDSEQIACRQGALDFGLTLENGVIPASGVVKVTGWTIDPYNNQTNPSRTGTLAGVSGTITRIGVEGDPATVDYYEFTRDTSGSVVSVADGTPFIFDDAVDHVSDTVILWAGRNDSRNTRENRLDIINNNIAVANHLKALNKRFLILPISNMRKEEGLGTSFYDDLMKVNRELEETFGHHFADLRTYMVERAIYDAGITPTQGDIEDMEADSVPQSLQSFTSHYNAAGYEQVAKFINRQLKAKGW